MAKTLSCPPSLVAQAARLKAWSWQTWVEIVLLAGLAIQCAALVWALVIPIGAIGAWEPRLARTGPADTAVLRETDPFFRAGAAGGAVVVTGLDLTLHGVRQDQGGGRGSAIIATPDGIQHSFAVGDEILPGVVLAAVGFDNVTLARGGTREQLFMDQSGPAKVVGGPAPAPLPNPSPPTPPAAPSQPPVQQ